LNSTDGKTPNNKPLPSRTLPLHDWQMASDIATICRHDFAKWKLKEINAAKRAARPPSDAKGSNPIEYLYGHSLGGEISDGEPVRFRITKKTAKRVFYIRRCEYLDINGEPTGEVGPLEDAETVGFVDRRKLEQTGEVSNYGRHWCEDDYRLYASFEACVVWRRGDQSQQTPESDLRELKAAMVAAHPDKGGTKEAFIEARKRYVEARHR
jgi:hypothetical protein